MGARTRLAVLTLLLLAALARPAYALDPILMFLFSAAREIASRAEKQNADTPPPAPQPRSGTYPGTAVTAAQLRHLIDECFGYLTEAQRTEVFDSLHATLMDPKNAAVRGAMIDYFIARAVAVREAQQRLAQLDDAGRARLVGEFKGAVASMAPEEAAKLEEILRKGVLPVPPDLNSQLLAAIAAR